MLRVLMEKADNMQQMDNISGEMEILRKNFKVMLKIKNIITEMRSAFDELSRTWQSWGMNLWVWWYDNRKLPQNEQRKDQKKKKEQSVPELPDNYKQCNTQVVGIPDEAETEKGT